MAARGRCPECGSGSLVEDAHYAQQQLVCAACGCVLSEGLLTTTYTDEEHLREVAYSQSTGQKEQLSRCLQRGIRRVQDLCKVLKLPAAFEETAVSYFQRALELPAFHLVSLEKKELLGGCCVLVTCRQRRWPLTMGTVCSLLYAKQELFASIFLSLQRELGLSVPALSLADLVTTHLSSFRLVQPNANIPGPFLEDKEQLVARTMAIVELASATWLVTGRHPVPVVTAAAFLAWQSLRPGPRLSCPLARFCRLAGVELPPPAQLRLKELLEILLAMASRLSWLRGFRLDKKTVVKHIGDLLQHRLLLLKRAFSQQDGLEQQGTGLGMGSESQECQGSESQGCQSSVSQGSESQECQSSVSQECQSSVSQGSESQECQSSVSQGFESQECQGSESQGSESQECQGSVNKGSESQGCQGSESQGCQGSVNQGSVSQGCQGSESQECQGSESQECQGSVSQGCQGSVNQECQGSLNQGCQDKDSVNKDSPGQGSVSQGSLSQRCQDSVSLGSLNNGSLDNGSLDKDSPSQGSVSQGSLEKDSVNKNSPNQGCPAQGSVGPGSLDKDSVSNNSPAQAPPSSPAVPQQQGSPWAGQQQQRGTLRPLLPPCLLHPRKRLRAAAPSAAGAAVTGDEPISDSEIEQYLRSPEEIRAFRRAKAWS
ncbi:transcription factor IIIB 50 kDa subunit [Ammospiza nelsoni]|uniref:transcription factor IIIB 50 kDa subunit n=1 Tax=Ammospiza nelsoni TaxID=2857394 RepID=UPI00286C0067|nr:transcription factor IIIB 50 kDa subunit [Ammospiza nelsoni]